MKYLKLFALFLLNVFCSFCNAQNKTELPTGNTKSEAKDVITSHGPNNITRTIMQDRKATFGLLHRRVFFDTMPAGWAGKTFTNKIICQLLLINIISVV